MIKRRNLIWLIPLALITTFPVWRIPVAGFLAPRLSTEPPTAKNKGKDQNFNMDTVKILQSKDGRITAEIRAQKAFTTKKPSEYMLDTVDADLFNNEGEPTNIVAKRGLFNGSSQQLTLMDDVVITKPAADQHLFTELLYYDDGRRFVHCPGKTRVTGKDIEVTGTGLDYDIEKGAYDLDGRVLCVLQGSVTP